MEMHQIRYFLATCETGNFTRAAEAINVSQPALTKAIKALELELGGTLFDRQARPVQLTELGKILRRRFAQVVDLTSEIQTVSRQFLGLEGSVFALGMVNSLGDDNVLRLTARLQRALPGVELAMHHLSQEDLLSGLRDGMLELAILADSVRIDARYDFTPIYCEPYVAAVPDGHPLAKQSSIALRDLDRQDYVVRSHCERNAEFQSILDKAGIEPKIQLTSDQDAFVRRMVGAGLGMTVLPRTVAGATLQTRPLIEPDFSRTIGLASHASRHLSDIAGELKTIILNDDWGQRVSQAWREEP